MYENIKTGHFQVPVSRLTVANVAMHWQQRAKNTIREVADHTVISGLPSGQVASLSEFLKLGEVSEASLPC